MYWLLWRPYSSDTAGIASIPAETSVTTAHKKTAPHSDHDLGHRLLGAFDDQAVCVLSRDGECVSMTDHWQFLSGHPETAMAGNALLETIHPSYRDKLRHRLAGLEKPDVRGAALRCQMRHADGGWHWYDLRIIDVEQTADNTYFTCLLRQVTEAVQGERKLQRALAQAELALKSRSEFLANMSHELRTPLNAILGFSQIMQNQLFGKIGNSRYMDYLSNIQESGHSLLDKINDLLEISHIDSGRVSLAEEQLDVTDLVRSAMEIHSHHAFSKRITVHEHYAKTPLKIRGDRVKLKQVLSNLISNALTYNQNGGSVSLETACVKDGEVTVTVTDNGKGISAKQIREIHSALQQKESFFERPLGGVGLGLALAKEFLGLHGGSLSLESKGGGCKAVITIPKARVVKSPAPVANPSAKYKNSLVG